MIYNNNLQTIGHKPVIKQNRFAKELPCEIFDKCSFFFNPGGSIKDRIGYAMVQEAEQSGKIKPGNTLIETPSGNTGIGIALAGAVKVYHVINIMSGKMSMEKQIVLERLRAEIYRTATAAAWNALDSHISLAKKLNAEIPNSYILNQHTNPINPGIHYQTTAQEIIDDFGEGLDKVVASVGKEGTITGIARRLIAEEGLLIGGSCGAALWAGIQAAQSLTAGQKCLIILPDSICNYLSKFENDEWMKEHDLF